MSAHPVSPYLRAPVPYVGGAINRALLPAAASHLVTIDLKTGVRRVESRSAQVVCPFKRPAPPRPEVIRRDVKICFACGQPIEKPKEFQKFCNIKCRSDGSKITAEIRKAARAVPPVEIPAGALSIRKIKAIVARVWRVPLEAMSTVCRKRVLSWPRQAAMELCYRLLPGMSGPIVGRAFGNRDHTTVMYAIAITATRLRLPDFAAKYREAEAMCMAANMDIANSPGNSLNLVDTPTDL